MKKRVLIILVLLLAVLGAGVYFSLNLEDDLLTPLTQEDVLFDSVLLWAVPAAVVLGLILGVTRAKRKVREKIENGEVIRHGAGAFLEHWGTALGIIMLIASGVLLGFLFIPSRVNFLDDAVWMLNLHFVGIVVTLFAGSLFAADFLASRKYSSLLPNLRDISGGFFGKYLLRRKWTAETKYLSSQKAAFLAWAVLGVLILATGAIKLAWRVWPIQADVLGWATVIHDWVSLLIILMLVVHVLMVLLLPAHRKMLKSWITGKVPEEYVKEEHPIWYEELEKGAPK